MNDNGRAADRRGLRLQIWAAAVTIDVPAYAHSATVIGLQRDAFGRTKIGRMAAVLAPSVLVFPVPGGPQTNSRSGSIARWIAPRWYSSSPADSLVNGAAEIC